MSKKHSSTSGVEHLPQQFDIWQIDSRQMPEVVVGGNPLQPWLTAVVSATDGRALGSHVTEEPPRVMEVWGALTQAMREPVAGTAHRPTEVQLLNQEWADVLQPSLAHVGVRCVIVEELEEIDSLLNFLGSKMDGESGGQALVTAEGLTIEAIGSFFDGAAIFFEMAPWKKVGERPIRIECAQLAKDPWYAVLMGQGGMTSGLALYQDLDLLLRIQSGDLPPEEMAQMTEGLAVVFGTKDELPPADAAAAGQHGSARRGPQRLSDRLPGRSRSPDAAADRGGARLPGSVSANDPGVRSQEVAPPGGEHGHGADRQGRGDGQSLLGAVVTPAAAGAAVAVCLSKSRISVSNSWSLLRGGAAATSSFLLFITQPRNLTMKRNNAKATMMKLTTSLRNFP